MHQLLFDYVVGVISCKRHNYLMIATKITLKNWTQISGVVSSITIYLWCYLLPFFSSNRVRKGWVNCWCNMRICMFPTSRYMVRIMCIKFIDLLVNTRKDLRQILSIVSTVNSVSRVSKLGLRSEPGILPINTCFVELGAEHSGQYQMTFCSLCIFAN